MGKTLAIFFTILVFGITVATTIHSIADIQEHVLHLSLLGGLLLFFISYVLKDTIKIRNRFAIVTFLLLFAFSVIRVFPCHLLSSNPQDIAHATVINHPCCSAMTSATAEVSIASSLEKVVSLDQKPHLVQLPLYIQQLTNKSPPSLSA